VTALDVELFRLLYHGLKGPWLPPMVFLSAIGGGWGAFLLVPLYAYPRTRPVTRPLAVVLLATALLVLGLKRLIGRARPYVRLNDVQALVFAAPTDFSFPSGHAAGSFAFCVFLATLLVRARPHARTAGTRRAHVVGAAALLALAVGVGLSRIALGVHFPGDVFGGAVLGGTIGLVGAHLHLDRSARA